MNSQTGQASPSPFSSRMKTTVFAAIALAVGTQLAFASTATEVSRFVKTYRIGETQRISLESMINGAVQDKRMAKADADCVLRDLVPKKLAVSAKPVVAEHFKNEKTLKAINDFFETTLGRKILDHGAKAHVAAMKDMAEGRQPSPIPDVTLSPKEIKLMDTWESSPAYAEFKSFVATKLSGLEATGNNDLRASVAVCQAKDKGRT